nr:CotH kinase family protein [Klebsiella pneumoniae]
MPDAWDNNESIDSFVNSSELTVTTRTGIEYDTMAGMQKKADDQREQIATDSSAVVEQTRQNLIPLSRQYMTLDAAQADIANIPEGSTTYYRSPDDSSLAIEVINNAGTLEPTGRKMPSQQAVDDIAEQTKQTSDGLQHIYLAQQLLSCVMNDLNNDLNTSDQRISETVQRLVVSQQVMAEGVNELSTLPDTLEDAQLHALYAISVLGSQLMPLDGIDLAKGDQGGQSGQLATLMAFSELVKALTPLDGFNPENTGGSGDAGTPLKYPGVYAYGTPRGLIRMDLSTYNGLPSRKEDDPRKGQLKIDIDGEVMNCYVMISVQGATSAAYPKKNLSLEFYPDNTFDKTVSLKIGDMLPHDELVFKANWIDSTHVRNAMSYNLWDKVEETRKGWPKRDIDNTYVGTLGAAAVDDGATGHPTGYACILYVDGDFYGIGDFMCGKKRSNYRIAKNSPKQILLGFDGAVNIPALPADGTYEMKAPSKPNADTEEALNLWRSFAQSPQADFTANRDIHLDKNNIVDFYVFLCFVCAPDCVQKNTQFLTWDGVKWYFMPYDLDTVFGLRWDGKEISYAPTLNLFDNSLVMGVNRTFWNKVLNAYRTEINARYKELRDLGVFSVDMVYSLARDLQSRYTAEMFLAEYAKWPNVPSLQITSLDQILNWTKDRIDYLDGFFSYTE